MGRSWPPSPRGHALCPHRASPCIAPALPSPLLINDLGLLEPGQAEACGRDLVLGCSMTAPSGQDQALLPDSQQAGSGPDQCWFSLCPGWVSRMWGGRGDTYSPLSLSQDVHQWEMVTKPHPQLGASASDHHHPPTSTLPCPVLGTGSCNAPVRQEPSWGRQRLGVTCWSPAVLCHCPLPQHSPGQLL